MVERPMNDLMELRLRLQQARDRCDAQLEAGPARDAAKAEVEELALLIWRQTALSDRVIFVRH
jgi:hypothetical protein